MTTELAIPKHVGFIMDGNRRWARTRGLPVTKGHEEGTDRIEPIVEYGAQNGIDVMTFWAFSTENWKRDPEEVEGLMAVFRQALKSSTLPRMIDNGVKLRVVGEIQPFPGDIQAHLEQVVDRSKDNDRIQVNIALNYGGRSEIMRAVNTIIAAGHTKVDEQLMSQHLFTAGQPDPDLVIRTGGEHRSSGFMPWQTVQSELVYTPTLWPDFTVEQFETALGEFQNRRRSFGK
jgi:undecaprenyl diphosphate synthase